MATTTQLAPTGIMGLLRENQNKVKARLPEGMDATKFLYGISTAIEKNPNLLLCKQESVMLAAYEAAEVGCDLSPSLALGWLIPYGKDCQFQPSYRFFVQRAYQTGDVTAFFAECVYEGDEFKRQYAPKRNLFHAPGSGPRTKDKAIGAYALIEFKDGTLDWEWCDRELVERHQKHSKQPGALMWTTFWEEGWRKTALRLLAKRIPLKTRGIEKFVEAVNRDAEREIEVPAAGAVQVERDSAAARPSGVTYSVGKDVTTISGNVVRVSRLLSSIGGKPEGKAWTIPASYTQVFLDGCESVGIPATELASEPQVPAPAIAPAQSDAAESDAKTPGTPESDAKNGHSGAKSKSVSKEAHPAPERISKAQEDHLFTTAASVCSDSFAEQRAYILKVIARYGFKATMDVTTDKLEVIKRELEQGGFPDGAER